MTNLITIEDSISGILPEVKRVSVINTLDAEINYAKQQLYKSEHAISTAQKNPVSVQNALVNMAAIGISLNPALKHAYLVPRDKMICLDVSYMGLLHLAQEIGSIKWGQAKVVYEHDTYENQGLTKEPLHKFSAFGDRGQPIGAYCTVKLESGDFMTEEMSAEEIQQVRNTSKSKDSQYSPWNTFPMEMWRKTVVKRASKYWPKSSERFDKAVHVLNEHEGFDQEQDDKRADAIKELARLTGDDCTPLELWHFLKCHREQNEDFYIWLYRQFPEGHKVSGKQKAKQGYEHFTQLKLVCETGSKDEIAEALEELTSEEYEIYKKELA